MSGVWLFQFRGWNLTPSCCINVFVKLNMQHFWFILPLLLNVFAGFLFLFSKSSLQGGWADVIFLSLHIEAAMPPYWSYSLFQTPRPGCGAMRSCESGRESAWSWYWHLFACRWLINIKQLFPCKPPCWSQVGVEHMFCLGAGPRIWIPHGVRDTRGCIRSQQSRSLWGE